MPARGSVLRGCIAAVLTLAAAVCALPANAQPDASEEVTTDDVTTAVANEIRSSAGGKYKLFYRGRGFWPIWVRDGVLGNEADQFIALIESASLDGLDPSKYDPADLQSTIARARTGSQEDLARAEIQLSKTFVRYVRDVRKDPAVKMTYLDAELVPVRPDKATVLRTAALAPSLSEYLRNAGWMNPIYARLRTALGEYRERWSGLPDVAIAPGPTLKSGTKGERVRMLRQRLGFPGGAAFDKPLAARLRAFQAWHGLPADAIAGEKTIAALNRGPAYYETIIRLNLERARVLPSPQKRHIVVDAASARMWMYEDGEQKDTMRVIVGKPTEPTPMVAGMMRYAVVNPYWNVPPDLVRRSVAPKILDGASLGGLGFEALADWTHGARPLDHTEIDWTAVAAGNQELRLRQLPGKTNAMGRMKFMFPNDLGIYLHDTPEKQLFSEEVRRFSSGCVRVQDAFRLARWLFGKPIETLSDEPERQVHLPTPVPVYITYLTAAPGKTGIAFYEDAYRRDEVQIQQVAER